MPSRMVTLAGPELLAGGLTALERRHRAGARGSTGRPMGSPRSISRRSPPAWRCCASPAARRAGAEAGRAAGGAVALRSGAGAAARVLGVGAVRYGLPVGLRRADGAAPAGVHADALGAGREPGPAGRARAAGRLGRGRCCRSRSSRAGCCSRRARSGSPRGRSAAPRAAAGGSPAERRDLVRAREIGCTRARRPCPPHHSARGAPAPDHRMTESIAALCARAAAGEPLDDEQALALAACEDLDGAAGGGARAARPRPSGGRELLAQGLHPADPAVPRRLPLLHLRARAARAEGALSLGRGGGRDRRGGRAGRLPRGAVHARRPARAALSGRARSVGGARAMRPRSTISSRSRGKVREATGLLPHVNPGVMSAGDLARLRRGLGLGRADAGIGGRAAVRARRAASRLPRQAPGGAARDDPRGGRGARAVHQRHPDRHRRDQGASASRRCSRCARCTPRTATCRRSSSRTSGPSPAPRWPMRPSRRSRIISGRSR